MSERDFSVRAENLNNVCTSYREVQKGENVGQRVQRKREQEIV